MQPINSKQQNPQPYKSTSTPLAQTTYRIARNNRYSQTTPNRQV